MSEIYKIMLEVNIMFFLLICCIYSSIFYFFAHRWNSINQIFSITIPVLRLFKHHLIAFFFSNGLPSTIGGDFWRIKELYAHTDKKSKAFLIPLIERLSGFFAVYILGLLSFFTLADQIAVELYQVYIVSSLALFFFFFFFSRRFVRLLKRLSENFKIFNKLTKLIDIFALVSQNKAKFAGAISFSIFSQLIYALCCYMLIHAMGENISYWHSLLVVPIVYFVSIIPISVGGFGLREGAFIVLLPIFGVSDGRVVAISFLLTIMQLLVSFSGGALFMLHKKEEVIA